MNELITRINFKTILDFVSNYKYPFIIFLTSRIIIFLVLNFANEYGLGVAQLTQWDAQHYVHIASNGYVFNGQYKNEGSFIAFFPLYPIIVRIVSIVTFLGITYSALIVSFIFGLASALLLYKIAKSWKGEDAAVNAVFLFSFFPMSVFLTAPYTESLFFFLVLSIFWLLEKKKLTLAAVMISLSLVTRITGLILIPIFIYELYKNGKSIIYFIPHLIITVIPLSIFLYFQYLKYGTPFAFFIAEKTNWYNESTFPWIGFKTLLSYLSSDIMYRVELIFLLIMVITLILARKYINKSLLFFSWGVILLSLSETFILSLPRYVMLVIPFYLFWGMFLVKHSFSKQLIFIVTSCWMAFNTVLFILSKHIF